MVPAMARRRAPGWGTSRWTTLSHPAFLACLALLLVNDHVLKARHPGLVTGKLSDFAGPVVVAVLAAVFVGRGAAVTLTAAGFVALKVVPGVAEAAEPLLGGVTRRDPTDLVGLLALPLAWIAAGPRTQVPAATASERFAWFPGVEVRRVLERRVLPAGGAALAVVALTATSQSDVVEVRTMGLHDTVLYAEIGDAESHDDGRWAVSDDGGTTWEEAEAVPGELATTASPEACRSDGRCYAARGATIERRTPDGEWTTVYEFTDTQRNVLDYRRSGGVALDEVFESVIVVPTPEGEHVVVGAADEGVVVGTGDGQWERQSVLDADATPAGGAMWPLDLMTLVFFSSGPVALLAVVVRSVQRRGGRWKVLGSIVGALMVGAVVWGLGIGVWAFGTYTAQNPILLALALAAMAVAVVLLPLAFVRRVDAETATSATTGASA